MFLLSRKIKNKTGHEDEDEFYDSAGDKENPLALGFYLV
jgi:hypothetical protein